MDYSQSRHFSNYDRNKILGFTIEFGKEFHPPWQEMERIIREVDAGLLNFCVGLDEQQKKRK
jgi:hypothetical protein